MLEVISFAPDRLFKLSILSALLVLIALSWNAPMSGDEYAHVQQAEKNIKYLKSLGKSREALNTPISRLKHYGQSFDTITVFLATLLKIDDLYRFRHLSNAVIAWLTIVFSALIVVRITNDHFAGLISVVLFLVSMRFMGHAMNNLKDVPFAFAFIFSIYFMFRFLERLPGISLFNLCMITLGISIGISIRIGGLLIFAYFVLFAGLYTYYLAIKGEISSDKLPTLTLRLLGLSTLVLIAGYLIAILLWPWALENPVANPIRSLQLIHNYPTTVRQIFEGRLYWSENFPWYYLFKYLLITVPTIVWLGFFLFIMLIWKSRTKQAIVFSIFLLIAFGFPLFYATVSGANVYGGWRQVLFVYPPMVSLSAIGIWLLIKYVIREKKFKIWSIIVFFMLLIYPTFHLVKHYPYQYVFFNAFSGGVKEALGNYELDYYFTSFKEAYKYIDEHANGENKIVAANFIIPEYYKEKTYRPQLIDYYDRESVDWDYAVVCNTFLDPYQLINGHWPPSNTVHTITMNDVTIAAVLKRGDKAGLEGKRLLDQGSLDEAVRKLNKALSVDPKNESILINLSRAYLRSRAFDASEEVAGKLERIYPNNEWAVDIKGEIALTRGEVETAREMFERNIDSNYKFYHSYVNLARVFIILGETQEAMKTLRKCLRINPFYQPGYQLYGKLLIENGEEELGRKMLEFRVEDYSKYKRK